MNFQTLAVGYKKWHVGWTESGYVAVCWSLCLDMSLGFLLQCQPASSHFLPTRFLFFLRLSGSQLNKCANTWLFFWLWYFISSPKNHPTISQRPLLLVAWENCDLKKARSGSRLTYLQSFNSGVMMLVLPSCRSGGAGKVANFLALFLFMHKKIWNIFRIFY